MKKLSMGMTILLCLAGPDVGGQELTKPLIKDFVGINGHFHFRPELYKQVCGLVRNYHKSLDETFGSPAMQSRYDVINLHTYAIQPKQEGRSPWARSFPEDPALDYLKTVDQAIAWRDTKAKDKAIWITEFGWDACTDAALKQRSGWFEKLNWQDVTDLQQAQYLVRSFLCFSARDVERAYLYYYNDDDKASVHASSGITRNFQPKASFWALKHFYETLGSYRFGRVITQDLDRLYVYEFVHGTDPDKLIWVAWSPTGDGREQRMTLPALPAPLQKMERMPVNDLTSPDVPHQYLSTGRLSLIVNESPVYILMRRQ
jgi:hypothetical protein